MMLFAALILLFIITLIVGLTERWEWDMARLRYWFAGGGAIAWILAILAQFEVPLGLPLLSWNRSPLFSTSPTLHLDATSWAFSVCLTALSFAFILTVHSSPFQLVWILGMLEAGILGVVAENTVTLLYAWVLFDVLMFASLLRQRDPRLTHSRLTLFTSSRLLGPMLLVWAAFASLGGGWTGSLLELEPGMSLILLAAATVRSVIWIPDTGVEEGHTASRFFVALQAGSAAVSLMLVTRIAEIGLATRFAEPLVIAALAALFLAALICTVAPRTIDGLQSWFGGLYILCAASALMGKPGAALAWGMAALLSGVMPFISLRQRDLRLMISILLFLGLGGWPFSPLWVGSELFSEGALGAFFGLGYGVLLFGIFRTLFLPPEDPEVVHPSSVVADLLGSVVLPLTQFVLGLSTHLVQRGTGFWRGGWWFLLPYATLIPLILAHRFTPHQTVRLPRWYRVVRKIPLRFSQLILQGGRFIASTIMGTFRLLEGRGGLIWAFLGLFFLLSMLAVRGG